jgi:hypothetical protein
MQDRQPMHFIGFILTHPLSSLLIIASSGQDARHTGSSQCRQFVASNLPPRSSNEIRMWDLAGLKVP